MAIPNTGTRVERALFWLACRLAWLVARAANRLDRPGATFVDIAIAKAALGFVSVIGWVVDQLLPVGGAPRRHSTTTDPFHPPFDPTQSNGHIQTTH
jgi:hypothetical protein